MVFSRLDRADEKIAALPGQKHQASPVLEGFVRIWLGAFDKLNKTNEKGNA